jgi:hypothetical protein
MVTLEGGQMFECHLSILTDSQNYYMGIRLMPSVQDYGLMGRDIPDDSNPNVQGCENSSLTRFLISVSFENISIVSIATSKGQNSRRRILRGYCYLQSPLANNYNFVGNEFIITSFRSSTKSNASN